MQKVNLKHITLTVVLFLMTMAGFAQPGESGFDATMRSHDKIYVVMAVCLVILIVVLLYLVRIDMKISKKEKNDSL